MTYPALELLVQAYLSLDWPDDYADVWAAVDDFVAREPVSRQLGEDVTRLLASTDSEEVLRSIVVGELGSGYVPEGDRLTMREWLIAIRERAQGRTND